MSVYGVAMLAADGLFGIAGAMAPFLVNVARSSLMGAIALAIAAGISLPEAWRGFIAVGFLGALTTFSSFALDAGSLLQRTGQMMSLVYICLSVGLSLLTFGAAHLLAGMLFGRGGG